MLTLVGRRTHLYSQICFQGEKGNRGITGLPGSPGDQGKPGKDGPKGIVGDTGYGVTSANIFNKSEICLLDRCLFCKSMAANRCRKAKI